MNESNETFGDRLSNLEKPDPAYRRQYERQVQAMLEKKLSPIARTGFALLALLGLWGVLEFGRYAFKDAGSGDIVFIMRVFMVPPFFLSVAWTVLTGWVAAAGKLSFRTHRPYIAAIALAMGFFLIVTFTFVFFIPIAIENKPLLGTQIALMGFFLLVTTGICVILAVLYRTQFDNQEKLLRIEYRLADLAERLEPKRSE